MHVNMHICTAENKHKCSTESFNGREVVLLFILMDVRVEDYGGISYFFPRVSQRA